MRYFRSFASLILPSMENFIRYDTHLMMELSLLEQSASAMDMLLSI